MIRAINRDRHNVFRHRLEGTAHISGRVSRTSLSAPFVRRGPLSSSLHTCQWVDSQSLGARFWPTQIGGSSQALRPERMREAAGRRQQLHEIAFHRVFRTTQFSGDALRAPAKGMEMQP